jgi:hypothetical protein
VEKSGFLKYFNLPNYIKIIFRPGAIASEISLIELPIRKILPVPNQPENSLICIRHSSALLMNNNTGQIVSIYNSGKGGGKNNKSTDFISTSFSAQGDSCSLSIDQ